MKMKGAEIIIRLLERKGIKTIAGIPGAANLYASEQSPRGDVAYYRPFFQARI